MAYQKVTLTQNGEYFAMRSGSHKTDIIGFNINGTFANSASLVETTTYTDKNGNIAFTDKTPFLNPATGSQMEFSSTQQVGRSVRERTLWHIYTVQNATGITNIEFIFNGLQVEYSETAIVEIL